MRAQKDSQGIYDFDALVREPRLAKVGGEIVDVSVIPVAVTLQLAARKDMSKADCIAAAEKDADGVMDEMFRMVSDVCITSNPKVTPEFLKQHMDYEKFAVFMKFVLQPMTDKAEEFLEGEEGNAVADETQSD